MSASGFWEPKAAYTNDEVVAMHREVEARPDIEMTEREDVFRIQALGMEWDIGVYIIEPADPKRRRADQTARKSASCFFMAETATSSPAEFSPGRSPANTGRAPYP